MRYLKPAILVLTYALISPAFAQTCCPAGRAPEANRCVTTGPLWPDASPGAVKCVRFCCKISGSAIVLRHLYWSVPGHALTLVDRRSLYRFYLNKLAVGKLLLTLELRTRHGVDSSLSAKRLAGRQPAYRLSAPA